MLIIVIEMKYKQVEIPVAQLNSLQSSSLPILVIIGKDGNEEAKSKETSPISTLLKINEYQKKDDQKEEDKTTIEIE